MDTMNKPSRSAAFGEQMAQAMAELRAIMSSGKSPTDDGRLTIRTIEVAEPSAYDARKVRKVRAALNVSQAVFARLVGVSDVLVRSWERGARQPVPIARRLLDQIRAHPAQFVHLVHAPPVRKSAPKTLAAHRKRNDRRAA
jgi:DNA-binding transcriptional regulator YiaG